MFSTKARSMSQPIDVSHLDRTEKIRTLMDDLDSLLGMNGNFWGSTSEERQKLESPDQIREVCRDLLVDIFGLTVRGL